MKASNIIIVDDDITCQVRIHNAISKTIFRNDSSSFYNGKEALEYLDRKAKSMDRVFIFLDINMPVLNGWGFLDGLQNRDYKEKINVLVISTSTELSDKKKANEYPQVMGYFEKPLEAKILCEVICLFTSDIVFSSDLLKISVSER
ncbi:MAG: response regulator [Anditalea sp.]